MTFPIITVKGKTPTLSPAKRLSSGYVMAASRGSEVQCRHNDPSKRTHHMLLTISCTGSETQDQVLGLGGDGRYYGPEASQVGVCCTALSRGCLSTVHRRPTRGLVYCGKVSLMQQRTAAAGAAVAAAGAAAFDACTFDSIGVRHVIADARNSLNESVVTCHARHQRCFNIAICVCVC